MSMSIPEMTALIARIPEPERSRIRDYIRSLENRLALAESALSGGAMDRLNEWEAELTDFLSMLANRNDEIGQRADGLGQFLPGLRVALSRHCTAPFVAQQTNPCKLTECQGKPRCNPCAIMDAAFARVDRPTGAPA